MKNSKLIAGLALALALPLTATAADLSWDFVDVRYTAYEEPGADGDGYGIAGSKALSDSFYVFGAYDDLTVDVLGFDAGVTFWRLGMGHHRPINDSVEYFADISYETISVDVFGTTVEDNGYGFRFGLRGQVAESLELSGGLRYVDTGFSDTLLSLGGVWEISEKFGLTASYEDGDASLWAIGARFNFGTD
jgi:hypothetical protein